MPANHQPSPPPPHNHQFMRCKQTIRSNNALQVLSPTIPLLIGKLICHTITSNGMPWHNNSNERTKKKTKAAVQERKQKKSMAKWKKMAFFSVCADTGDFLDFLISNYSAFSVLDCNSITMSFGNWIVACSAAATLSARKALSKAIHSTKAATNRIILCTK